MEKKFLFIIIIVLLVISINAKKKRLLELFAGDIVNINDFKELSTETVGNIFESYRADEFTKTDYFTGENYTKIKKKTCLSLGSLISYSYPEINIDDTEQDPAKIFNSTDTLRYNYFGISENYINNEYLYGIVKICRVERTENLNIRVIDDSDFPSINNRMNYKLLLDETSILRLKGNNGTHVVSSITTGECLLQVINFLKFILK